MKKKEFETIEQYFFWCYSNMAMAHAALSNNHIRYEQLDYMIRSKLYKGLNCGTMHIHSIFDDEKYKLNNIRCCYCGGTDRLSLDHLIARKNGGTDTGDNLVYACKNCNSSKNKNDLLVWCFGKQKFPPILVLRRYLKLAYLDLESRAMLTQPYSSLKVAESVFRLDLLPYEFPQPEELTL